MLTLWLLSALTASGDLAPQSTFRGLLRALAAGAMLGASVRLVSALLFLLLGWISRLVNLAVECIAGGLLGAIAGQLLPASEWLPGIDNQGFEVVCTLAGVVLAVLLESFRRRMRRVRMKAEVAALVPS